jgi:hypothetical protein
MTAVGKILVFVNLVFSLVVGGLVIAIYTARTHWESEYNQLKARYQVAVASEKAAQNATAEAQRAADGRVAEVEAKRTRLQTDLETQIAANTNLQKENSRLLKETTKQGALSSAQLAEVQMRQSNVDKLRQSLKAETERNITLVAENTRLRGETVSAQVQAKAFKDISQRLEKQVQAMAIREAQSSKSVGGPIARRAGERNPPLENVEGLIRDLDSSGRLVTLTIGSDHGLSRGQTLEAFRLSPIPSQSKYLGTLRIIEVRPTQAVAEPTGRLAAPLQVGDRVASRIMSGG